MNNNDKILSLKEKIKRKKIIINAYKRNYKASLYQECDLNGQIVWNAKVLSYRENLDKYLIKSFSSKERAIKYLDKIGLQLEFICYFLCRNCGKTLGYLSYSYFNSNYNNFAGKCISCIKEENNVKN